MNPSQSFVDCKFAIYSIANFVSVSDSKDMQQNIPQNPKISQKFYTLCKWALDYTFF